MFVSSTQPGSIESGHLVQRENLLAALLDLLNCDKSTNSGSHNTHKLKIPSYKPGDLGIVPPQKGTVNVLPPIDNTTSLIGIPKQTYVQWTGSRIIYYKIIRHFVYTIIVLCYEFATTCSVQCHGRCEKIKEVIHNNALSQKDSFNTRMEVSVLTAFPVMPLSL